MSTTKEIRKLVKAIEEQQRILATDLSGWDPRTKPGMEGAQNRAQESLGALKDKYREALKSGIFVAFVTGKPEHVADFKAAVKSDGTVPLVEMEKFYQRFIDPVEASMGNQRLFTANQCSLVGATFLEIAREMELFEIPRMEVVGQDLGTGVPTTKDVKEAVDRILHRTWGTELHAGYLEREVMAQALVLLYDSAVMPVFVTGVDPADIPALQARLFDHHAQRFDLDAAEGVVPVSLAACFDAIKGYFAAILKQTKQ